MLLKSNRNFLQNYLREIVYGGVDGIVTTLAVVAGFAGANSSNESISAIGTIAVLIFGFANLFADATSMGIGNFLSIRSEKQVYKKEYDKLLAIIKSNPKKALSLAENTLVKVLGNDAKTMAVGFAKRHEFLAEFILNFDYKIPNPESTNPFFTGIVTFLSFIFFGLIPIFPYLIFKNSTENLFFYSLIGGFIALFVLAILRWRITAKGFFGSIIETIFLGSISTIIAFIVGNIINNLNF